MKRPIEKIATIIILAVVLTFTNISIPVLNVQTTITARADVFSFVGDLWKGIVSWIAEFAIRNNAYYPITSWFSDGDDSGSLPISRDESAQLMIEILDEVTSKAYEYTYAKVESDAREMGYDVETTVNSFATNGNVLNNIDYAYILSVYSLKNPDNTLTIGQFKKDMEEIVPQLINVEYTDATTTQYEAVPFYKYEKVTLPIDEERYVVVGHHTVTSYSTDADGNTTSSSYTVTDYGWRHYVKEYKDFYRIKIEDGEPVVDFMIYQEQGRLVPDYQHETVEIYQGWDEEPEVDSDTYYLIGSGDGEVPNKRREFPIPHEIEYGQVSATAFSNEDIWDILGIDREEKYFQQMSAKTKRRDGVSARDPEFKNGPTNYEWAQMRYDMFKELYNVAITSAYVQYREGLTLQQIEEYLNSLPAGTSGNRKQVIKTALVMVSQLPYCNNGEDSKPKQPGYDSSWYDYSRCDSAGRPSGLDSSGFVQWVFWTAGFSQSEVANLKTTSLISNNIEEITDKENIKPGDIGLIKLAATGDDTEKYNRVGIYLNDGKWIINSPEDGTVVIEEDSSFNSIKVFSPRMEDDDLYKDEIIFYAGGTAEIGGDEATLYTICQIIIQECGDMAEGTLAVAECVKNRAVDNTDFRKVKTAWEVLTQKGQFEAYLSGAYKKQQPSSGIMTRIKQVFNGKVTVLNNIHVLYFVSEAYHKTHYGSPDDFRTALEVFGNYGGNVYYIDAKYRMYNGLVGGASLYTSGLSSSQISQIKQSLGGVPKSAQEVVMFAASCIGKIPYYYGGKPGSFLPLEQMGFGAPMPKDKKGRTKKGLDCSGFVSYVLNYTHAATPPAGLCCSGIASQGWTKVHAAQLQPGDIGVKYGSENHTGIYAGNGMWIHCAGGSTSTVTYNAYSGFTAYFRPY